MLQAFTRNYQDNSTDAGFQFTFYCDNCNDGYKSSFIESETYKKKGLIRGLGQGVSIAGSLLGGKLGKVIGELFGARTEIAHETEDKRIFCCEVENPLVITGSRAGFDDDGSHDAMLLRHLTVLGRQHGARTCRGEGVDDAHRGGHGVRPAGD